MLHFVKLTVKQNGVHQYTKMAQKVRNAHAGVKRLFGQNGCTVATIIYKKTYIFILCFQVHMYLTSTARKTAKKSNSFYCHFVGKTNAF